MLESGQLLDAGCYSGGGSGGFQNNQHGVIASYGAHDLRPVFVIQGGGYGLCGPGQGPKYKQLAGQANPYEQVGKQSVERACAPGVRVCR